MIYRRTSFPQRMLAADPTELWAASGGDLEHWTWFPVAESQCLDGTSTGFGVRLGQSPTRSSFYLEEGACVTTPGAAKTSSPLNSTPMTSVRGNRLVFFNQADVDNPFRTWTPPFISHTARAICTLGVCRSERDTTVWLIGLSKHQPLPEASGTKLHDAGAKTALVGSSAGGFGVTYNWAKDNNVLAPVPVDVIDDSGPFLSSTFDGCYHKRVADLWNQAVLSKDCEDCLNSSNSFMAHLKYTREQLPNRRYALITEAEWTHIRAYFGFAQDACSQWGGRDTSTIEAETFMNAIEDYHHHTHGLDRIHFSTSPRAMAMWCFLTISVMA